MTQRDKCRPHNSIFLILRLRNISLQIFSQPLKVFHSPLLNISPILSDSDDEPGIRINLLPLVAPDFVFVLLLLEQQVVQVSDVRYHADLHQVVPIHLLEEGLQLLLRLVDLVLPGNVLEEDGVLGQVEFLSVEIVGVQFGGLGHEIDLPLHPDGE